MSCQGKQWCLSHTSWAFFSRLSNGSHGPQSFHWPRGSVGHLAQGGIWWLSGYHNWWGFFFLFGFVHFSTIVIWRILSSGGFNGLKITTLTYLKMSCITGVPDCSEADLAISRSLNLSWTTVVKEDDDGMQTLINSAEVSALSDWHNDEIVNTVLHFSSLPFSSSRASPGSRDLIPLPKRPENKRLEAILPALSSGTGWYRDSGTGAHLSLWYTVNLVAQSLSLKRSYQLRYQSWPRSQEKVLHLSRQLMTGSSANVPGEKIKITCLNILFGAGTIVWVNDVCGVLTTHPGYITTSHQVSAGEDSSPPVTLIRNILQ